MVLDRYLIPIIPLFAMFLLSRIPRDKGLFRSAASWVLLGVIGCFSVAGTQDYFARARERWHAIDYLVQSGIAPHDIEAGFEHAALYSFAPKYRQPVRVRPYLLYLPAGEREVRMASEHPPSVWQQPRSYVVIYDQVSGIEPVAVFPWRSWFRSGNVIIYRRAL
jgi:hypothetical protein